MRENTSIQKEIISTIKNDSFYLISKIKENFSDKNLKIIEKYNLIGTYTWEDINEIYNSSIDESIKNEIKGKIINSFIEIMVPFIVQGCTNIVNIWCNLAAGTALLWDLTYIKIFKSNLNDQEIKDLEKYITMQDTSIKGLEDKNYFIHNKDNIEIIKIKFHFVWREKRYYEWEIKNILKFLDSLPKNYLEQIPRFVNFYKEFLNK